MVKYQHGYNALARLVSYIDEILDILIMGWRFNFEILIGF